MKPKTRRLFLSGVVASLLATSALALQLAPPRPPDDLERLQGRWEGRGPGGACSVTIDGNSLFFHAREDFWYATEFTLPSDTDPPQLHATIVREASPEAPDVGRVVVALFKVEDGTLQLGVVDDFDEPPTRPVDGDWEWTRDDYYFEKAEAAAEDADHAPTPPDSNPSANTTPAK